MPRAGSTVALASLGVPLRGSFFRSIPLVHTKTPLSAAASTTHGGRYNPIGSFEVLYAAADRDTVPRETGAVVVDPATGVSISLPKPPSVDITIDVDLQRAVDLTNDAVCKALGIRSASLLLEWRGLAFRRKTVPTHRIGCSAFAARVEALIVPSARSTGAKNIAILIENLLRGSSIAIVRPEGFPAGTVVRIDGSA